MSRGIKKDVDEMIKFLETRAMMLPFKTKDGKEGVVPIQANLQPIQLWSYVFPENEKDAILTALKADDSWNYNWKMKKALNGLRLMAGAKKIPEFKKDKSIFLPKDSMKNIALTPIGVKYDKQDWWDEKSQTYHEKI